MKKSFEKKSYANRKYVYDNTTKPEQYVHVDEPNTLQDLRQIQYNEWCKSRGVYNVSYLPKDCETLLKKGWEETKQYDKKRRFFRRKSNGQKVRFDLENNDQIPHYHWLNPNPTKRNKLMLEYIDRYGKPCTKKDDSHHLAPLDEDCPKKANKKYLKNRKENIHDDRKRD